MIICDVVLRKSKNGFVVGLEVCLQVRGDVEQMILDEVEHRISHDNEAIKVGEQVQGRDAVRRGRTCSSAFTTPILACPSRSVGNNKIEGGFRGKE